MILDDSDSYQPIRSWSVLPSPPKTFSSFQDLPQSDFFCFLQVSLLDPQWQQLWAPLKLQGLGPKSLNWANDIFHHPQWGDSTIVFLVRSRSVWQVVNLPASYQMRTNFYSSKLHLYQSFANFVKWKMVILFLSQFNSKEKPAAHHQPINLISISTSD